ncbi:MAG: LysM peptidoglycan-binding domain-containing protein [Verrucomicrobiota bacterium]
MRIIAVGLLFGLLLLGSACTDQGALEVVDERDEKHFNRAQSKLSEQRYDDALSAFLKVIEKRREAPESHLEVGMLYQEYRGDPIAAIYHYRRYLEILPESKEAPMVKQMVESAKKDFARQLAGQPFNDEIDRLDLMEILEVLRGENLALKEELAASKLRVQQLEGATVSSPEFNRNQPQQTTPRPQPAPTRPRTNTVTITPVTPTPPAATATYVVQEGDTLSRISRRFYGTDNRWQDIFYANRDVLPSPNALRVGQTLKIPAE